MSDIESSTETSVRDKMRRTINSEFVRMEDDFDITRNHRSELVTKIMDSAKGVVLIDEKGNTREDTETGLKIITTALKALESVEKADAQAILLKLKQTEQEIASSAATRDRIAIILKATEPGRIVESFPVGELEDHLAEMFDKTINDFELKTSSRDLSD